MSWPPVAANLYTHGAPTSYFVGVSGGDVTAAIQAAYGELATLLAPRCGGDPASWTWTHTAGQETATRDVCRVAAADLAMTHGLVLPGEGADPQWAARAQALRDLWSRMGSPGMRPAQPLYAGLVDATPLVTEGAPRGWSVDPPYEEGAEA